MDRKKILLILSAVIILAIVVFAFVYFKKDKGNVSEQAKTEKVDVFAQAANLADISDFGSAIFLLEESIKSNPTNETKILLASIYLDQGDAKGMQIESSQKAQEILFELEKSTKTTRVYDLLGYSFEIIGDADKAIENYNKALEIEKNNPNSLFGLGHAYLLKGDDKKAYEYYTQAEKSITDKTEDATKSKIYSGLGSLSFDHVKAEEYFLKAIGLSYSKKSKSQIYSNLANLKIIQKDNAKALEYANKAIKEDPMSDLAKVSFAKAAMSEKSLFEQNQDKIGENLFKAIILAPSKVEPQYWQGKFDFAIGNIDMAIKDFENTLLLVDQDMTLNEKEKKSFKGDINLDLAVAYHFKKDNEKAKSYAKEALNHNPVGVMYILQNTPQLKELYEAVKVK